MEPVNRGGMQRQFDADSHWKWTYHLQNVGFKCTYKGIFMLLCTVLEKLDNRNVEALEITLKEMREIDSDLLY